MSINKWLETKLENGEIAEEQIIAVYNKNRNLVYLGKANFAPIALWDEIRNVETVGNEIRINEVVQTTNRAGRSIPAETTFTEAV